MIYFIGNMQKSARTRAEPHAVPLPLRGGLRRYMSALRYRERDGAYNIQLIQTG